MAKPKLVVPQAAIASSLSETVTIEQLDLTTLADQINAAHVEVEQSLRRALQAAYTAGQALLEVKSRLNHGEFLPWVAANCHFSQRTANDYMQLANHWEALANSQHVANLSIREALAAIRQMNRPEAALIPPAQAALQDYYRSAAKLLAKTEGLSELIGLPAPTQELQQLQRELARVLERIKSALATLPDQAEDE